MTTTILRPPLVDSDWIAGRLDDGTTRIVEIDVAPGAYREGHIPGAVLWNIYADLRAPAYAPIDTEALEALLSRSGVRPETTVVFYGYGAHLGYWLLRSHGHTEVRLMDGPREQWLQTVREWSLEEPTPEATAYPLRPPDPGMYVSSRDVLAMIGTDGAAIHSTAWFGK